jgi:hypothetical protein
MSQAVFQLHWHKVGSIQRSMHIHRQAQVIRPISLLEARLQHNGGQAARLLKADQPVEAWVGHRLLLEALQHPDRKEKTFT